MADKMRWDCRNGTNCFSRRTRLKFYRFEEAGCLPARTGKPVSFSDIDAITEVCGRGLIQEWKLPGTPISQAQRIMLTRLTRGRLLTAVFVWGDAEHMTVEQFWPFFDGEQGPAVVGDFDALCRYIAWWSNWAERNSLLGRKPIWPF